MSVTMAGMRPGGIRLRAAAVAMGFVGLAGCYGYIAPPRGASLIGSEAQLWLSDSGAVVLASTIGPAAAVISGRVVSDSGNAYVVALSGVRRRDGDETAWRGERVLVARALIVDAGTRRFSASRTVLFSGIVSAGLFAARQAFIGRGSGGGGGGVSQAGNPR
jgi:hypothetical protein